ncbi:thiamine biosynthesis protein ThiS [Hahella chejuensis KCTC 2396]|uniref:Thiamine biosynthesis protein ThiS n=1 Tax=Hahella chejuensis (strain KCTC 2396) TaxID=349521 RepID=Q2SQL6_HAHCH|nr:sulfur carrier protein ThiS [Hahella chejuensis]ABC27058.1 thiamine biosynthesis protein ThiS [Hahella chejuensis KCTC 2396]
MPPDIEITLNGEPRHVRDAALSKVLETCGYQGVGFAVAINGEFVPRSAYTQTAVNPGDMIDVVAPVAGG